MDDADIAPDDASRHHLLEEDCDESEEEEENEERISASDGLSPEVLAALLSFQMGADEEEEEVFDKETVCGTYRPEDAQAIAETLRRLHERHANKFVERTEEPLPILSLPETTGTSPALYVVPTPPSNPSENEETTLRMDAIRRMSDALTEKYVQDLASDGVIRINQVLSPELCAACLEFTNQALEHAEEKDDDDSKGRANSSKDIRFGNVFERENRFDMYLRPNADSVVETCLQSLLQAQSPLGRLFTELRHQNTETSATQTTPLHLPFHELSCLVSDPGSLAQPLHPDSPYYPVHAPLWTVFCALQAVTPAMGPTVLVPGTHTAHFHQGTTEKKDVRTLIPQECRYYRADLSVGDCIVMDARTFHYGSANTSLDQRRSLLYFTLRNPYHVARGYPPSGSLYPDLDGMLTTAQYMV